MKIKNCLISNSSSSSFIIAAKSPKAKITIEIDLAKYDVIETKESLDNYFVETYGYRQSLDQILQEEEYLRDNYKNCLKALEAGKTLYFGDVSNDPGDDVENFLYGGGVSQLKGKELEVIVGE